MDPAGCSYIVPMLWTVSVSWNPLREPGVTSLVG